MYVLNLDFVSNRTHLSSSKLSDVLKARFKRQTLTQRSQQEIDILSINSNLSNSSFQSAFQTSTNTAQ